MNANTISTMKVIDLEFDSQNPRLAEFGVTASTPESDLMQILWREMDVHELVLSISASGFFRHEPIIVAKEGSRNVVIEGNRRLAAVKALLNPSLIQEYEKDIPLMADEAKKRLEDLPVILGSREDTWRYIGFKHVNGPVRWSSYAKSQYIAKVHRDFKVPLNDIAMQIGDTHKTVQRLFRGIMVIEQAERMGTFDRDDRWNRRFAVSHLYTGLDYSGIGSFLGIHPEDEEMTEPVPPENRGELKELFQWLYGSKKDDVRPVIQSQNPDLRRLNAVVANSEAIAALRGGVDLAYAFEISRPSSSVFEESIHAAKRDLEKAHSLLSTGYDGSEQLLFIADDVLTLAEDLFAEMERKRMPRRRRRIVESN